VSKNPKQRYSLAGYIRDTSCLTQNRCVSSQLQETGWYWYWYCKN